MAKAKNVSDTVDLPEGLDVIPTVPGTFVGGHDVQGTDGTPRTDRPGEILGTPVTDDATKADIGAAREKETAKHDAVREAVDRNNRDVLPLLGGNVEDGWEEGEIVVEVPAGIRITREGKAAGSKRDTGVTTAKVAEG
jgi:hypothetical protein